MTRLLIVEDEPNSAEALCYYFRAAGYEVALAARADEALAAADTAFPDLLLTDLVLKGEGDGMTVARQLLDRDPSLPVVAMTWRSARSASSRFTCAPCATSSRRPSPRAPRVDRRS